MPLQNLTISQLLRRTAAQHPQRPALEHEGLVLSYRELDEQADRYAQSLLDLGVKKGDHVAILCEAEPNAVIAAYALTRIGAVAVMLNTSLLREELEIRLRSADVKTLLIGDVYKDLHYPTLCQGMHERILYIGRKADATYPPLSAAGEAGPAVHTAEALVSPQDPAFILFTSGTGSAPKAVVSSHFSRANSGIQQAKDLAATCEDRFCVAMPIFHCFCLSVNVMAACAVGACLYLPRSRRTAALLDAISEGKCTVFSCVPALYRAILKKADLSRYDLSSLRTGFIGGSTYPEELFEEVERRLGFTLLSSLGQTEATAGITTSYLHDPIEVRRSTVGHFMDHVEGRIADAETGAALPAGQAGEICVRGYVVMQGYYAQPEETAKVIDKDGWLHTGDVGWMDENGNIHLEGRLKELIIRGGENISPKEIETVFFDDPQVKQCKAVGVPDEHYGEEICLCVCGNCTESELREKLARKLAAYKMPKYIRFYDELPATATGKIKLQELKAMAARDVQ